jgi:glutamate racemase
LVFDSGVGGLSVLTEIRARVPGCELVYACDNGAFPYGTKNEGDLVERVDRVLRALVAETAPDIVVIACNTASTVALPRIRTHFHKPVVGVVPAIKPAAKLSRTRVIGLLGTAGTVSRPYTQQLIDEFAADCTVLRLGSARLVEMAEDKLRGMAPNPAELRDIISPLFAGPDVVGTNVDTLVLACTHFPLLAAELAAAAPHPVHWVDSGEAIARRVLSLLPAGGDPAIQPATGFDCWLTAAGADFAALEAGLLRFGGQRLRLLVP